MKRIALVITAAVITATSVSAQDDELLVMPNFRDTSLESVVEFVASATKRKIVPDVRMNYVSVTFYGSKPITTDQLWTAFVQILQSNGLAAIESGDVWTIAPLRRPVPEQPSKNFPGWRFRYLTDEIDAPHLLVR